MKCYCKETEREFIYCVEGAKGKIYDILQADPYWEKVDDNMFVKVYPMDTGWDDAWYAIPEYKEAVKIILSGSDNLGLRVYSTGKMFYCCSLNCLKKMKSNGIIPLSNTRHFQHI